MPMLFAKEISGLVKEVVNQVFAGRQWCPLANSFVNQSITQQHLTGDQKYYIDTQDLNIENGRRQTPMRDCSRPKSYMSR